MLRHFLLLLLFLCPLSLFAQFQDYAERGQTPAELMFVDKPFQIERKEPSFWRRPKKSTPEEQLAYADQLLAENSLRAASKAYNNLVYEWHASPQALQAQLKLAKLLEERELLAEAYDENIYLLAHFAGSFQIEPILTSVMSQADFLANRNRTFLGLKLDSYQALRTNYERIIHFAPRWEKTPDMLMKIAALYEKDEMFASAITIYDRIIVKWQNYEEIGTTVLAFVLCCEKQAGNVPRDLKRLQNLENLVKGAITHYPFHKNVEKFREVQNHIHEMRQNQAFLQADYYDKKGYKTSAALLAYQDFLRNFPNAPQAQTIRERIAQLALIEK